VSDPDLSKIPGLPEGITLGAGGPPVSMSLFIEILDALRRTNGPRLLGKDNEVDEIRKHLGHIEVIYRTLPEDPSDSSQQADDLEESAKRVEHIKREAHDYGLEAFPKEFWESCELIEEALQSAADDLREKAPPQSTPLPPGTDSESAVRRDQQSKRNRG